MAAAQLAGSPAARPRPHPAHQWRLAAAGLSIAGEHRLADGDCGAVACSQARAVLRGRVALKERAHNGVPAEGGAQSGGGR